MKGGEHMGNQKILFSLFGAIIVAVVGFTFLKGSSDESPQQNIQNTEVSESSADVQEKVESSESGLEDRYVTYSPENLSVATENDGRAVIFFAASWCPSCKEAEKDFQANFEKVPEDVTILKTDYDTATDLKAKYSITMQDTFVQVDKNGDEITKWNSGGEGIKTLLANIE